MKVLLIKITQLISLLIFSSLSVAQVIQLTASVDRNTVLLDESLTLTVIATGNAAQDALDFNVLRGDFSISRPSFSQSTQIINGSMSRTISWQVSLYPLQTGKFTIPSFSINGQNSKPFDVTVLPINAKNTDEPRDYFVEATVSSNKAYLQQQLLYTIKIYLSQEIQRGNLNLPVLEGAIIEQVGEDKDYQEITDGVRYRIIERNYAIIPQSSGNFTIAGPIFEAQVLTSSRQSFANFGRTRTIARRAPNVDIEVLPMPENYAYPWLPSEYVEVSEEWQGDAQLLKVGEPITRTITLTAIGLTKEQLPELSTPYHPSFKVYPEQPQLSSVEHKNAIVAQGVFNTAVIPGKTGSFVLPEVKVPWFNVNTGKTEFASVPARTVEVEASAAQAPVVQTQDPTVEQADAPDKLNNLPITTSGTTPSYWIWILISTNVFTLIMVGVLLLTRTPKDKPNKIVSKQSSVNNASEEDLFRDLKSQLELGSLSSGANISEKLDTWLGKLKGNNHHSVSLSLSKATNSASSTSALSYFNKILAKQYAGDTSDIDLSGFVNSLQEYRTEALKLNPKDPLNNMYPQ